MRARVRAALACAALLCVAVLLLLSRASAQRDSLGGARQARLVGERAGAAVVGSEPALYTYKVVRSFPHDPTCFTQGLVVRSLRCALASALGRRVARCCAALRAHIAARASRCDARATQTSCCAHCVLGVLPCSPIRVLPIRWPLVRGREHAVRVGGAVRAEQRA